MPLCHFEKDRSVTMEECILSGVLLLNKKRIIKVVQSDKAQTRHCSNCFFFPCRGLVAVYSFDLRENELHFLQLLCMHCI